MKESDIWRQGYVIHTKNVQTLSEEIIRELEYKEKCRIYKNFTVEDEGRSRQLVTVFQDPKDAAIVASLHNTLVAKFESYLED